MYLRGDLLRGDVVIPPPTRNADLELPNDALRKAMIFSFLRVRHLSCVICLRSKSTSAISSVDKSTDWSSNDEDGVRAGVAGVMAGAN